MIYRKLIGERINFYFRHLNIDLNIRTSENQKILHRNFFFLIRFITKAKSLTHR